MQNFSSVLVWWWYFKFKLFYNLTNSSNTCILFYFRFISVVFVEHWTAVLVDPSFTSCSLLRTDRGSARDWSHERHGWLSPEGFLWAGAPRPAAAAPGGARGLHRQQHPAGVSGHPQRIREQHHAELHGRLQRPLAQHHGVGYVSRLCLPHVRGCRTRGRFPVQSNDFRHERKDDCLWFLFSGFSAWASHVNTSVGHLLMSWRADRAALSEVYTGLCPSPHFERMNRLMNRLFRP